MKHVVIIGNGISGITAARYIRKLSNHRITVISGESNHFYSRPALMYIYMGHMRYEDTKPYEDSFWQKNRIALKRAWVSTVNSSNKSITFTDGTVMQYDDLILATGSVPNRFGWPGQDLTGVQGLYSLQDLETMQTNTKSAKHAVIVGGGLIGVEMAEMLHSRGIGVTMLVRENRYWGNVLPKEEAIMIERHLANRQIDVRLNTEMNEIKGGNHDKVEAVVTNSGESISCQFVGLTTGVSPNISFLESSGIETDRGILINEFLETATPGVYALGDCAQFRQHPDSNRSEIEQVWYTGRMMGEILANTICGNRTAYKPGVWFNSAKFFDLEYQTYGWVRVHPNEDEQVFYWQHQSDEKCLRLVYDKRSRALAGINTLGIRLRHVVCEHWIKHAVPIEVVLAELKDTNFDPEFFKRYEKEIIAQFNQENGTSITAKKRCWKRTLQANE